MLAAIIKGDARRPDELGHFLFIGGALVGNGRLLGAEIIALVRDGDLRLLARDLRRYRSLP